MGPLTISIKTFFMLVTAASASDVASCERNNSLRESCSNACPTSVVKEPVDANAKMCPALFHLVNDERSA